MLEERDGRLYRIAAGREVVVARVEAQDKYRALLKYQVQESIAAAVAAKIITIRLAA